MDRGRRSRRKDPKIWGGRGRPSAGTSASRYLARAGPTICMLRTASSVPLVVMPMSSLATTLPGSEGGTGRSGGWNATAGITDKSPITT